MSQHELWSRTVEVALHNLRQLNCRSGKTKLWSWAVEMALYIPRYLYCRSAIDQDAELVSRSGIAHSAVAIGKPLLRWLAAAARQWLWCGHKRHSAGEPPRARRASFLPASLRMQRGMPPVPQHQVAT